MNALFLKDLAEKTHRGLRGHVEAGKAGGGLCYGYRVVHNDRHHDVHRQARDRADGSNDRRAQFSGVLSGRSPKQIVKTLNQQGVAGPFGGKWSPSTIYSHAQA